MYNSYSRHNRTYQTFRACACVCVRVCRMIIVYLLNPPLHVFRVQVANRLDLAGAETLVCHGGILSFFT